MTPNIPSLHSNVNWLQFVRRVQPSIPRLSSIVSLFPIYSEVWLYPSFILHILMDRPGDLEKDAERDILNEHAAQLEPELAACESWLKCNIEGIEADQLLIRFSHIDEANVDREFSFVLDVSTPSYNGEFPVDVLQTSLICIALVITTTPPLPALPILLRELNQTGDVYRFIKCMRSAFRDLLRVQS